MMIMINYVVYQKEILYLEREFKLSELSEQDEEIAREELKNYDELEHQIEKLDGTDKQIVDEYQWEINDHNNEIGKVDKELDQIQEELNKSEQERESHANELKILTDIFSSLTSEIEQVHLERHKLREQQHILITEQENFQSIFFEKQQIWNDENAKMIGIEQQINIFNNQKHLFQEQQNKLNQTLIQNETGLLSLEEQIKNLNIELEQLKSDEKNLQIQLKESEHAVEQIVQQLKETEDKKAECVTKIQQQEVLLYKLEREQQQINIQIQHLKNLIERIKEFIRQVCNSLSTSLLNISFI